MKESFDLIEYKRQQTVRHFLGTEEQIFNKVKSALDALKRGQKGSFKVGTPGFINIIIEAGGQKVPTDEWKICKHKVEEVTAVIQEEQALREEVNELREKICKEEMMEGAIESENEERKHVEGDEEEL